MQTKRATLVILFLMRQDEYLFLWKPVKVLKFELTFLRYYVISKLKNVNNLPQGRGKLLQHLG